MANLWLLRATGSLITTGRIFVIELCIAIFAFSFLYGNHPPEFYVLYPTIILITTFVLGKRWCIGVTALIIAEVLLMEYLRWIDRSLPENLLGQQTRPTFAYPHLVTGHLDYHGYNQLAL